MIAALLLLRQDNLLLTLGLRKRAEAESSALQSSQGDAMSKFGLARADTELST